MFEFASPCGKPAKLLGRRGDGSEFPVEISLSPVASNDQTIVLTVIRDISDRKRIEEELRRANEELDRRKSGELRDSQNRPALIVDSSQDAIIAKNLDGYPLEQRRGTHLWLLRAGNDRPISVLVPKERVDEIPAILEKIRSGERVEYFESVRVTKDKRHLDVSISVSAIHDMVRVRGQECPRHINFFTHYFTVTVSNCAPLTT